MIENKVLSCILDRASCRIFDGRNLSKEEEDTILQAAMRAPSAANLQLYSIIIIRDKATKQILADTCNKQPWLAKAPFMLIFLADYQRIYDYYDLSGTAEKCKSLKVPYIKPGEQFLLLAAADAMLAAENAVIAGESIGVASCFVGHIMDYYEKNKELLNLPRYVFPISILAMGYPQNKIRKKTPRLDRKYVIFEEKYQRFQLPELEECYSRFPNPQTDNIYKAENKGQYHYLSRYLNSPCYWEGIRSLRVALENWNYELFSDFNCGKTDT